MYSAPPAGITPPTPGLEHEEPELALDEYDIPVEDETSRKDTQAMIEGTGTLRDVERE